MEQLDLIDISPFKKSSVFENSVTRMLSDKFNISKYQRAPAESMGAYELERTAEILLGFSVRQKRIVGIDRRIFEAILEDEGVSYYDERGVGIRYVDVLDYFFHRNYIKEETKGIYPTEELLKNQQVLLN